MSEIASSHYDILSFFLFLRLILSLRGTDVSMFVTRVSKVSYKGIDTINSIVGLEKN